MQLNQVKAIVTGGISGLGNAVARHIINQGGQATLFDINEAKGNEAVDALGAKAHFLKTDVTDEATVIDHCQKAHDTMHGLNVLINCAGILGAGRMLGKNGPMALDHFKNTVMVNLVGSFNVAKAASALMQHNEEGKDGERGVIINTASVAAYEGQIGQTAYSASKGGIVSMTLPMARELARFGVRVASIAPGVFWTPMVDGMPEKVQQSLSATIPFPSRLGQPDEYAQTVAFILGNRYINGETIRLDGAIRMTPK